MEKVDNAIFYSRRRCRRVSGWLFEKKKWPESAINTVCVDCGRFKEVVE